MKTQITHNQLIQIACNTLALHGWTLVFDGAAIAQKVFKTYVGEKTAHVYTTGSDGYNYLISGNYESQGRNVLSTSSELVSINATEETCVSQAINFAQEVEKRINESFAMRLTKPIEA